MLSAVEGEVASQPMCPQHPERVAVLTCARCGRYACSSCERAEGRCRECGRLAALEVPDSRARARRATVTQYALVATSVVGLLFHLLVVPELEGQKRTQALAEYGLLLVVLGVTLVERVCFLMWVHRVVRQLEALGADIGRSPASAVWMWLIPFLNWVKPYQVMRDIAERVGGIPFAVSLPLQWWWASNVLARILDRVDSTLDSRGGAMVDNTASLAVGLLSSVCIVGTSLLCVQVIKEVQARLDQRREGPDEVEDPVAEDEAAAA